MGWKKFQSAACCNICQARKYSLGMKYSSDNNDKRFKRRVKYDPDSLAFDLQLALVKSLVCKVFILSQVKCWNKYLDTLRTGFYQRHSESSDNFRQEDSIGEKESMNDHLYDDNHQEQDNSPSSLWIIMLENAGNPPLPVSGTARYDTIICLTTHAVWLDPELTPSVSDQQLSITVGFWSVRTARGPGASPAPDRRGWRRQDMFLIWHHGIITMHHPQQLSHCYRFVHSLICFNDCKIIIFCSQLCKDQTITYLCSHIPSIEAQNTFHIFSEFE